MEDNKTVVNGGIGFVGLLQIAFIILKITGLIKWSWVWVLSPLWLSTILSILFFVVMVLFIRWLNK